MQPELFHIPPPGALDAKGDQRPPDLRLVPGTLAQRSAPVPTTSDPLCEKTYARLAEMLTGHVGIRLPPSKRIMVEGRLRKRVRALGLPSIAEYCRFLFHDNNLDDEFVHLIDAVTTNKTDFFREPQHFEFLKREIVPSLLANRRPTGGHFLKVWSAAASAGAEAYSIAMQLNDLVNTIGSFRFAILGTDISTEVLTQARRAVYPEEMIQPIPPDMQMRYLMRPRSSNGRAEVRIVPELRRLCRFVRLNLMDTQYPFDRDVDVIFLRNVLIYFDKPTQESVIARLVSHLRPGGFLLLGHSESMIGTNLQLRQVAPAVFQHL